MLEHFFNCPYCGEEISVLLDPSQQEQNYVEDCEVCCNPMEISVEFEVDQMQAFSVRALDQ